MKWILVAALIFAVASAAAVGEKKKAIDWECPACKYAVQYAQKLLESGNTTAEIEAAVHKECMTVFGTIAPFVCDLLDNEVANIVQYLEGGDIPAVVCQKIKLCQASANKCQYKVVCKNIFDPSTCQVELVC